MVIRPIALAAALVVAATVPAFAKNDKAPEHGVAAAAAAGAVLAGVLLSDADRRVITRYFQTHPQPATSLPPGIAKNLARGKPLPPGIAKKAAPQDLSRQISIPSGYALETVGTDVVLIELGTRIVADVLKGVPRP
ncbi:MAG: anti-virulence regulator CigR family protein [Thalassobaculaceae bacterium]|nr:anti-virulence regulator CigR family protein [Thalassobaculaceae bacterium]